MENATRRIENLAKQIIEELKSNWVSADVNDESEIEIQKAFDPDSLHKYLFPYHKEMRNPLVNDFLSCPLLAQPVFGLSLKEERALTRKQFEQIVVLMRKYNVSVYDFIRDPKKIAAFHQCYRFPNIALSTLFGVHFSLFGATVLFLGTDEQRERYIPLVENLGLIGCFGLTELGHGSNVQHIETIAEYDHSTQEFVLNSPTVTSQKYFIGGAATNATHSVIFAQLKVGETMEGVHAFVVNIRDKTTGQAMPGVRIADCGHKMALNGVDNGRMMFKGARVPRDQLLSRYGGVNKAGIYSSPINPAGKRFAHSIGALVFGRYIISLGCVSFSAVALTTAIRYAFSRKQFSGDEPTKEKQLISYATHQRRLFPHLANTYATHFLNEYVLNLCSEKERKEKEIHIVASGIKAYGSWMCRDSLQEARECCGGQGFLSANLIGPYKSETEIYTTFEGDNALMYQQVSKFLLTEARKNPPQPYQQPNSTQKSQLDSKYLRSFEFIQSAFNSRLNHYTLFVTDSLSDSVASGKSIMNTWNDSGNIIFKLGQYYTEKTLVDKFHAGVVACPDPTQKHAMMLLFQLFAMNNLEKDPWFLRYQFISPEQSEAINQEVTNLCKELVPYSVSLADAFGFDYRHLGPISRDWVSENKY
ncbi:acyl-CoA oxidase [Tieghemostelium lacteum]|uniref:Acyl-coenzyme A oxidase n=1 Tax=Tieghemostelium lacteum TaxID=361077 RepID=A0A151ZK81_TIELA|nr:acyl-CoA oxidase [Tieghemostelium lacteum]|eukprot:KYQ94290.1 acyl-CoA oxidase [Tieghemostelium lacteum]